MFEKYHAIDHAYLDNGSTYQRPPQLRPDRVTADNPATDVMTDFSKVAAMTMGPCASLSAANQRMISSGVRLLLVTDQYNAIMGLITYNDIHGDRPTRYLQEVGGKRDDIYLREIMTPQDRLEVLNMNDVNRACVGDIVKTLQRVGRQHALVVETTEGRQVVRGLFSTKQIGKQLGVTIQTTEVARTFAEVGAVLAS